jgi:hypothetical protein
MALDFKNTKGKAEKGGAEAFKFTDGDMSVRLHGGILPRYMYWVKGTNDKDIPLECLAFDRNEERFNNKDTDHVQKFFPEVKCSWAYSVNCIDLKDGKSKVFNLKKKLFEQILTVADTLGDPTDPDTGWDIVFKRTKTGTHAFNVEYTLKQLACKVRPLTEQEREVIAADKTIDEKYPRPTSDDILKTLERITKPNSDEDGDGAVNNSDGEAVNDLA